MIRVVDKSVCLIERYLTLFNINKLCVQNEEHTYGFELSNKSACKQMWKCCIEHQNFFKLTQNTNLQISNKVTHSQRFRSSSLSNASANDNFRERPPPTVVRVPSRRYQRRMGQPDGADGNDDD